jgi:hypothetical protein
MAGGRTITPTQTDLDTADVVMKDDGVDVKPQDSEQGTLSEIVTNSKTAADDSASLFSQASVGEVDETNASKIASILSSLVSSPTSHSVSTLASSLHAFSSRVDPDKTGCLLSTTLENPPDLDNHKRGVKEQVKLRMDAWRGALKV